MSDLMKDRVRETCVTPGTGTVTLLGAPTGFQSFSVFGNGNKCYYTIADRVGSKWEVGIGTWNTGGTLTRTAAGVLAGSSGAGTLVNFDSGTQDVFSAFPANLASSMPISVKAFGASGDGVTDDTTAIQAAIDAGKHIYFPIGQYKITSTLTVTTTHTLVGAAASGADTTSVSEILSTVEGPAISIAPASGKIYNCAIKNLAIKASGAATSSASAIGLKLTSSNYGHFENLSVQGFASGYGIQATAVDGAIGASNGFYGLFLYNNKYGINFTGYDADYADFASYITGGTIIGYDPVVSGSVGILISQHADGITVFGTDVENFDYCIDVFGDDSRLIGTRTENQNTYAIRVDSGATYTAIFMHKFATGATSTHLNDSGTTTIRTDFSSNVRINEASLEFLNNVPLYMQESGGTARQILKLADNDTVQLGSSANGNYGLGTWNFTSPVATGASGATGYQNPIYLGSYALWVDSTGDLRITDGAPSSDTDGTVVGTQS